MFWGVILESGKRYSQIVQVSYHLSMACLEPTARAPTEDSRYISVMIEHGKVEYILCTLEYGKLMQQPLDCMFVEGEEVSFFLNGEGTVHLTGYVLDSDMGQSKLDFSEVSGESRGTSNLRRLMDSSTLVISDEDEEDDEDWKPKAAEKRKYVKESNSTTLATKRIKKGDSPGKGPRHSSSTNNDSANSKKQKRFKASNSIEFVPKDSDADSEDSESKEDEDGTDSDISEVNSEVSVDESSDEKEFFPRVKAPGQKGKSPRLIQFSPSPETSGSKRPTPLSIKPSNQNSSLISPKTANNASMNFHSDSQNQGRQQKEKRKSAAEGYGPVRSPINKSFNSTPGKKEAASTCKKLPGGTQVEDIRVGTGSVAKPGKFVHVYYVGCLENNLEFDSHRHGKPFSFKLGRGEVIKGWDVGLQGMKVGGKRKLVVPASQGYQDRQNGPIPPNSTLFFEVELKGTS